MPDLDKNKEKLSITYFKFILKMQLPGMQDDTTKYRQHPVATEMLSNIGEVTMYAIVWSDRI